ncbi:MAG: peptide-methionine (R)-S-oxide reductase MsrB [Candidatus Nanoarchaeia archaeon]|nr:peptide-methionine (R)-S-oxide reductase MsrB [Candidatus Nanoarchaeia archaeon]
MPDLKKNEKLKKKLSKEQLHVMREKGTEAPFSGKYVHTDKLGNYVCAFCSNKLFDSKTKFDSGTGWPSFSDAIKGSIKIKKDFSHFMIRDEVICSKCGSHLGHLFFDLRTPTKKRYCINSAALDFKNKKK